MGEIEPGVYILHGGIGSERCSEVSAFSSELPAAQTLDLVLNGQRSSKANGVTHRFPTMGSSQAAARKGEKVGELSPARPTSH